MLVYRSPRPHQNIRIPDADSHGELRDPVWTMYANEQEDDRGAIVFGVLRPANRVYPLRVPIAFVPNMASDLRDDNADADIPVFNVMCLFGILSSGRFTREDLRHFFLAARILDFRRRRR